MANIVFEKGTTQKLSEIPIGNYVLFDTEKKQILIDHNGNREQYGGSIAIDEFLNLDSTNPVQNKVITRKIGNSDISRIGDGTITGAIADLADVYEAMTSEIANSDSENKLMFSVLKENNEESSVSDYQEIEEIQNEINEINSTLKNVKRNLLWQNENLTEPFENQEVTLLDSLENYDYIEIESCYNNEEAYNIPIQKIASRENGLLAFSFENNIVRKVFMLEKINTIEFSEAQIKECGKDEIQNDNSYLIPTKIYGIKNI